MSLPRLNALVLLLLAPITLCAAERTYTNPLLPSGPDPWIARQGQTYYFMATHGDRLAIRKTTDLGKLADARDITVWTPPATGANATSIWAPELHRIGKSWFIYYTATDDVHHDDAHRGIFVLQNDSADPTQGRWTDRGRLKTAHAGIDGTTFTVGDKRYFVYSPYVGPDSVLAIVAMTNPWTLTGAETVIAKPDQSWERQGGRQILEGPEFLQGPHGDLFLTYSGSACWSDDYAIGLLSAKAGSDPLKAGSWTKAGGPVLKQSAQAKVFAPGHNGFFDAPGGDIWIVYHANPGPHMQCTAARAPRMQRVDWSSDGRPVFNPPETAGTSTPAPAD